MASPHQTQVCPTAHWPPWPTELKTQNITAGTLNINKVAGNLFLTNSIDSYVHLEPHKKRCSVHENRSVDFLCVVCNKDICQLCKMSEHEGHETKSIPLAAEDAKNFWISVSSNRIKQYEQSVNSIIEDTKMQMQDLQQTERTIEDKINERYDHIQCLIGVRSSDSCSLLARTFEERFSSAQIRKTQQWKRSKCFSPVKISLEETMTAIHLRQDTFQGLINKQKEQKIEQLKVMGTESLNELEACVKSMEDELADIANLRKKMDVAISENDHIDILNVCQQVKVAFSAEQLRTSLRRISPVHYYTFHHKADEDIDENDIISDIFWNDKKEVVETYIQNFLGCAVKSTVPARKGVEDLAVQLKPAFRCSEESDAIVESLCPHRDQRIMVSFSFLSHPGKGFTKTFDTNGEELELHVFGRGTLATIPSSHGGVAVHFLPAPLPDGKDEMSLFAKHEKHYSLKASTMGTKYCFSVYLVYSDESNTMREARIFKRSLHKDRVHVTAAFDAARSGESFAVVNVIVENTHNVHGFKDGTRLSRELLITDRNGDDCYVYEPPTPKFSPTDVCFLNVNGEEVLAIADMETDSIHLACRSSDSGKYVFVRYLNEDHPLLVCPTALTTDTRGRLWVACKGGHLLIAELVYRQ